MTDRAHDPYPDGKTGPWLRSRHKRSTVGTWAYDERCAYCRKLEAEFDAAFDQYAEQRMADEGR